MFRMILCSLALFWSACRTGPVTDVDDRCQGQGIYETLSRANINTPRPESPTYRVVCSGVCTEGSPCDTIVKRYFPPKRGVDMRVFCGCGGEEAPLACDVVLEKRDTIYIFVCTALLAGCPAKGDSCIQVDRTVKDTIRTVATGMDSLYRTRRITTCECINRKSL